MEGNLTVLESVVPGRSLGGLRLEDHQGVFFLGLWKPRPERKWKDQEGFSLSPKSFVPLRDSLETQFTWKCVVLGNCGEARCTCDESPLKEDVKGAWP